MSYKILWTTNAYSDFSQIVNFIKERWGRRSAEDFINRVDAVISFLGVFPQLGKSQVVKLVNINFQASQRDPHL